MTVNKAFLALALGMALMACHPPAPEAEAAPAPEPKRTVVTTHPQEVMKNHSMHSRFVAEKRVVYGSEVHILIDTETGVECMRNPYFTGSDWSCVATR